MLTKLGRWIRAAGYDAHLERQSRPDKEIFLQALRENRLLITRDKHFIHMKGYEECVLWIRSNDLESSVRELKEMIGIDWLMDPFSRCLKCNEKFVEANEEDLATVPSYILNSSKTFWKCPECRKVYWEGSHTISMLERLTLWKNG
ncbi:MAG: hypothetical protein ACI9S8_000710 [Chlamydiales bacterium]|jgi:uncharacterized protein with PIN domain